MKRRKFSFGALLMAAVILLYLGTFLLFNTLGFAEFATADVYADTLYAMEAWDSRSIFPDGWTFGNQYYVIGTPVLAALFYGIIGSPNAAMALATTVMTVLLLFSLDWMIRPFAAGRQRLAAAMLFLGGMTVPHAILANEGQLFFLLASYYSCYCITLFLTLGDYLRALFRPARGRFPAGTLGSILLLFATGMHSLRQTAVCVLPLCALEVLRLLLCRRRHRPMRWRTVTGRVALYLLANLGGVGLMHLLDVPRTGMFAAITWRTGGWREAAAVNGRIFAKLTGFWYAFHEEEGWLYFLLAALFSLLLICSVVSALRRRALPWLCLQAFFLIGMAGLMALNFFFTMTYFRTIYCFGWYAFSAVSIGYLFAAHARPALRRTLALLCTAGCIGNYAVGYAPDLGRCFSPEAPAVYGEIADYLCASDCDYLYGSWWLTTLVALRTDGACRAGASYGEIFTVLPYINPQNIYGEEENARALYLFTAGELPAAMAAAEARGAALTEVAAFENRTYLLYRSDMPLMQTATSSD